MQKNVQIFALLLAFAALLAGLFFWQRADQGTDVATALPEPRPLPEFQLEDAAGGVFDRTRLQGAWTILFFGFTHCPDICPDTLALLHSIKTVVREEAGLPPLNVVFVSLDPERDTYDKIRAYVNYFDTGFVGVTGKPDELKKLTEGLYLPYSKAALANGGYTIDHSAALVLVNPKAEAVAYFSPPHRQDAVVADLKKLVRT